MKRQDQIMLAGEMGRNAFVAGKSCAPASDKNFMKFLQANGGREVGKTPTGEAPTLALLGAWIDQWQRAAREHDQCAETPKLSTLRSVTQLPAV
jgi:hypothetical protein